MLCEGTSIRAITRITGASKNTVAKLLNDVGAACAVFHDDTIRGVKANEDLFTLQIVTAPGNFRSFAKNSVRKVTRLTGQSPMPAFDKLPPADLDNLVAYLASLRGNE